MDKLKGFDLYQSYEKELKSGNRFFPDSKYIQLFQRIIRNPSNQRTVPSDTVLFRARCEKPGHPLEYISDLGVNKTNPSHNRASPIGIPYMYLADEPNTALAEIRANVNDTAVVATFTAKKNLKFFSLDNGVNYDGVLNDEFDGVDVCGFIFYLGIAFSRPIHSNPELEYLPSQYFAEYCKNQGFDGIRFISSACGLHGDDTKNHYNYVLFDDANVEYQESYHYFIDQIIYKTNQQDQVYLKNEGEK